ncbi:N-acetylmuramidase family protein [Gilvibacter sediminis]|uniref:N-acetylmuramidase family protein n=1 Tax=Gilvibacter sediminis TaxID=379071 RepID=UPI002350C5F5|nr:N-acetylmuramidase family protein [Gilvibacter sediminis]MDC7998108.1 N-acetylmuramidase family protein [Gilvibacter sediminis]
MRTLRYRSQGDDVHFLEEILVALGFRVKISEYFGLDTQKAVMDFQRDNNLVVDGIVGPKTWSVLIAAQQHFTRFNDKFLSEQDLIDFASKYNLELPVVKAVNEVESSGKGFLIDGRPRILFEGHIFWKQLAKRDLNPEDFVTDFTANILYKSWTKNFYEGGEQEYDRLEKAAGMSDVDAVHDAAYCSASYGAFQIMGFHYELLGYPSVDAYVAHMYTHEKAHLESFGIFCEKNNLIRHLKSRAWADFARAYNGPGFAENKYDTKLEAAYQKYKTL